MSGIGRNDPCPCGSGKKYKKCCMNKIFDKPDDEEWLYNNLYPVIYSFFKANYKKYYVKAFENYWDLDYSPDNIEEIQFDGIFFKFY